MDIFIGYCIHFYVVVGHHPLKVIGWYRYCMCLHCTDIIFISSWKGIQVLPDQESPDLAIWIDRFRKDPTEHKSSSDYTIECTITCRQSHIDSITTFSCQQSRITASFRILFIPSCKLSSSYRLQQRVDWIDHQMSQQMWRRWKLVATLQICIHYARWSAWKQVHIEIGWSSSRYTFGWCYIKDDPIYLWTCWLCFYLWWCPM